MKVSLKKRHKYRLSVALFSGIVFLLLLALTNAHPTEKSLEKRKIKHFIRP